MLQLTVVGIFMEKGDNQLKYFGTDGFRGEANVDLNVMHAYKVGRLLWAGT